MRDLKKTKNQSSRHTNIPLIYAVRYMLLVPILLAVGSIVYAYMTRGLSSESTVVIGGNLRIIALSLVAFVVTIAAGRLEKKYDVHLPPVLMAMFMVLIVASLVLGDAYGQYDRFWWWDDVLHLMSGVITAITGFLLVYFFNARYNMRINPLFIATFAFTFAITMGVIWEIIEFIFDALVGSNMQSWHDPANTIMIGQPYQGNGLRDTMSDLIVGCIGALVVSVVVYISYTKDRSKALQLMRKTFPAAARKSR